MKGVADVYPLTPSQLGILVDTQRDADPELYFEQVRFDLVGDVEPADLQDAWCRTLEHHPALRTVWLWEGLDQPVQVVRERVELPWTVLDWRDRDEPRPALDVLAADDRALGFDLGRPPVMRVTVVRLDDDRLHVVWSFHHIMLDGWSAALVLDEILTRHAGRQVADAPPFKEHVAWIGRQDHDAADRHWQHTLAGFDRPNVIAGCRPNDGRPVRLARLGMHLGAEEANELAAVARDHRVTVNTLVQTAWAITSSCLSGDRDVVFGVTGSGRPAEIPGVESIVGMFLATLPMRLQFGSGAAVAEVWRAVQAQQLDLTQYQYSSLAEVVRASDVPAGVALFDTALVFENFPRPDDSHLDCRVERHEVFEQTRFAITVMVGMGDELDLIALVDEHRIDRDVAERVIDGFVRILRATVEAPDRPADALTTLSEAERRRLLVDLNATDRAVPDSTVHDEIAARSALAPDAVAIVDGERSVTFAQLVESATLAGSRLLARGVGVGDVVVVACERSADAVVVALGAMWCGAAYLAVGDGTPAPRLRAIVEDAEPAIAVVTTDRDERFDSVDVPVVDVGSLVSPAQSGEDVGAPETAARPDDVMFVVFTSGSTGRPKGVPGTHRAVLNRCAWEREVAPFAADEVACQKTTFDFVDHVAELWGPLVAGCPVVIVRDEVVRNPTALVEALAVHRVRRIVLVPTLLDVLLDAHPDLGERLPELRRWTVSGERLPVDLTDRFGVAVPDGHLVNVYGMSEVMADATAYDVPAEVGPTRATSTDGVSSVPIGRPIHNQRVYVLDELDRPTATGVPGQIWVSGVGLMAGYWRRDDLTAERVVDNAFGEGAHARRYATGDIGRWTPDGQLEYVGRRDRQVKIRGQRVELGDAEAVLRRLPGVRDAVVVDGADDGTARLIGFVIGEPGVADGADLRRLAGEVAPPALVPERVEVVEVARDGLRVGPRCVDLVQVDDGRPQRPAHGEDLLDRGVVGEHPERQPGPAQRADQVGVRLLPQGDTGEVRDTLVHAQPAPGRGKRGHPGDPQSGR